MPKSTSTNMGDRVEALEGAMGKMEESLQRSLTEFRESMIADLTKILERQVQEPPLVVKKIDEGLSDFRMAVKKVELPMFGGDDPVGWITRAETYFEVQNTPEDIKVKLAKLSMEGATIHWFNLLYATEDNLTWEKFKKAMIDRYGGRQSINPFEELKDLTQMGSVDEYITEFEYISSLVTQLPEEQYLGYFLGGLRSDIRLRVRTFNPINRIQAMKVARDVESELQGIVNPRSISSRSWTGGSNEPGPFLKGSMDSNQGRRFSGPWSSVSSTMLTKPNNTRNQPTPPLIQLVRAVPEGQKEAERNRGIKHLPYAELMDRKAKGLCFRCGERYDPLHQCSERQLRVVILSDDEQLDETGEVIAVELNEGDVTKSISRIQP